MVVLGYFVTTVCQMHPFCLQWKISIHYDVRNTSQKPQQSIVYKVPVHPVYGIADKKLTYVLSGFRMGAWRAAQPSPSSFVQWRRPRCSAPRARAPSGTPRGAIPATTTITITDAGLPSRDRTITTVNITMATTTTTESEDLALQKPVEFVLPLRSWQTRNNWYLVQTLFQIKSIL